MKKKDDVCVLDEDDAMLESQEPVISEEKRAILSHRRANINVELIPNGDYWGWQF